MKCSVPILAAIVATSFHASAATVIGISQQSFTEFQDYAEAGQVFTQVQKGNLEGISLNIDRHGTGADVVLKLYTLNTGQTALDTIVATSTVKAVNFSTDSSWIYFPLDKSYTVLSGQKLAFFVSQPNSGAKGFVSFANSNANPYAGGSMVSGKTTLSPNPSRDLAFQTHLTLIPEPSSAVLILGGLLLLCHRKRGS